MAFPWRQHGWSAAAEADTSLTSKVLLATTAELGLEAPLGLHKAVFCPKLVKSDPRQAQPGK